MSSQGRLARDFGRIISSRALERRQATSEQHVLAALADSRARSLRLTVQGAGHSCNGQSLSIDGIQLVNVPTDERPLLTGDQVELSARSRWRDVETQLHRAGRTIPVLADYLDLSVGGTLSVGGYGVDSVMRGAQVDHVSRLRLLLPDGRAVWCSPETEPELFGYALAGLGQVGVIERVVMRTEPHYPWTTMFQYRHRSLMDLVRSLRWLAEPQADLPPFFKALHSRGRYLSIYGAYSRTWRESRKIRAPVAMEGARARRVTVPAYRRLRSAAVSAWLLRFAKHRRLWSDYLVSYDGLIRFTEFLTTLMAAGGFANCLHAVYIVAIRRVPRAVPFPLEAAQQLSGMSFGVGLYSMVPAGHSDQLAAVRDASRRCLDKAVAVGGRPYLYGWHEMDEEMRQRVYGAGYDRLQALRRSLDPAGLFQPSKILSPLHPIDGAAL